MRMQANASPLTNFEFKEEEASALQSSASPLPLHSSPQILKTHLLRGPLGAPKGRGPRRGAPRGAPMRRSPKGAPMRRASKRGAPKGRASKRGAPIGPPLRETRREEVKEKKKGAEMKFAA